MIGQNYRTPLLLSIAINAVFIASVAIALQTMSNYETKYNDLVVNIDMSKYEVSTEQPKANQPNKPVEDMLNGGKAGTILPDLSGKPTEGLKDLNPYLGGHEDAGVNVRGDVGSQVGNPGITDTLGEGGSNQFGTGTGTEGYGTADGTPAEEPAQSGGSFDAGGYYARVEANKVMPAQAARRNLTGTVSFIVTFDENGNFIDATMTSSSGYAILDNAAGRLVSQSGGIENTTGKSISLSIDVVYNFN